MVGWVRNEPDGAVALQAEGTDAAVDALLSWCRSGPPGARVEAVEVSPLDAAAALGGAGFEVRW